jgi:DNA-binding NarL/FixJ family response regulator
MAEQDRASRELLAICADARPGRPMVIVDLKSSSTATADFIARLRADCPSLLIVAMAPSLDREAREHLLHTGAAAVFERHSGIEPYRAEVRSIVGFWQRHQALHAVGA